jgi:hypothetical protein
MLYDLNNYNWETNILQDSLFISRTLAHHGDNQYALDLFYPLKDRLPIFTSVIILTANIEIRKKRLLQRIQCSPELVSPDDMLVFNNPDKFIEKEKRLIYHTKNLFSHVKIIDTSEKKAYEVANIILEG